MTTGARPCFPVFDGVLSLRDSLLKVFILYLLCSSYEQRYNHHRLLQGVWFFSKSPLFGAACIYQASSYWRVLNKLRCERLASNEAPQWAIL